MARKRGQRGKTPKVQKQMTSPNRQAVPFTAQGVRVGSGGVQWPGAMPTDAPYPQMPEISAARPMLDSIGAPGTAIFSGIITSEEYNPDWQWKDGIRLVEQMLRNDGQINGVRSLLEMPILRCKAMIEPASEDDLHQVHASFVETCLFHDMWEETEQGTIVRMTWSDLLRHILLMLWYGFSAFEINWKVDDDGWVKWAPWTPLLPRTVWRWWVNDLTQLVGVQQWTFRDYNYQFVDIPANKMALFVHRQEGSNYEGQSLLRTAYKHWFYKTQFEKIEAIGLERNAIVPPVVKLPENFTGGDVGAANNIVQNVRANEQMGIVLPPGWDFEYPRNFQKQAGQIQPTIQYHDIMIARNVLAQFINLGSTETGSYSQDASQKQTLLLALQSVCEYIEDVFDGAIKQLIDYNFSDVDQYPRLKFSKLLAQDLGIVSTALKDLTSGQNPLITPNPQLEDYLADLIGIPKPPRNPVVSTNVTGPDDGQGGGEAQEDDQGDAEENAEAVTMAEADLLAEAFRAVGIDVDNIHSFDAVERGLRFGAGGMDAHGNIHDSHSGKFMAKGITKDLKSGKIAHVITRGGDHLLLQPIGPDAHGNLHINQHLLKRIQAGEHHKTTAGPDAYQPYSRMRIAPHGMHGLEQQLSAGIKQHVGSYDNLDDAMQGRLSQAKPELPQPKIVDADRLADMSSGLQFASRPAQPQPDEEETEDEGENEIISQPDPAYPQPMDPKQQQQQQQQAAAAQAEQEQEELEQRIEEMLESGDIPGRIKHDKKGNPIKTTPNKEDEDEAEEEDAEGGDA